MRRPRRTTQVRTRVRREIHRAPHTHSGKQVLHSLESERKAHVFTKRELLCQDRLFPKLHYAFVPHRRCFVTEEVDDRRRNIREPKRAVGFDGVLAAQTGLIIHGDGITINKVVVTNPDNTDLETIHFESPSITTPAYNLSGQHVGENYKGIIIKNGKRYIIR